MKLKLLCAREPQLDYFVTCTARVHILAQLAAANKVTYQQD